MGVLIRMPEKPAKPLHRLSEGHTAEILIDMGVRYERDDAGSPAPQDGSRPDASRARRRRRG